MPLKVVVELQIHAVTCPGVFLPDKDDIFLNVSILGQSKETRCLPAVFPILFHEKMRFEKTFQKAVNPATVVELLEKRNAGFELIQLNQLGEEILATYKENHRDFLFPEPKLTPPYPGVDREVLMKTVPGFPGIAPKIEFSTTTTIKETANGCRKRSEIDHSKPVGEKTSSQLQSPKSNHCPNSKNSLRKALTFDCLHCDTLIGKDNLDIDDLHTDSSLDDPFTSSAYSLQEFKKSPDFRGSVRESIRSENNTWESIHNRVRNLLSTHSAKQRLSLDLSKSEVDRILERSSKRSLNNSLEEKLL
ncbi:spermatogenesis associated 6-like protein isoform X3 [Engystomops pustulosus]|uniref:spermatogenesis associated 6-like protein isoform X3 n=1 Tax=Engystomops pustulosus TaxID=76066 RepID=UPI003AFAE8B5